MKETNIAASSATAMLSARSFSQAMPCRQAPRAFTVPPVRYFTALIRSSRPSGQSLEKSDSWYIFCARVRKASTSGV